MRDRLWTVPVALVLLATLGVGCAPMAASTAIATAAEELQKADEVESEKFAPYSYWLSRAYLRKAKITNGYSEFSIAQQYAVRARELASKAQADARETKLRRKILRERLKRRDTHKKGAP